MCFSSPSMPAVATPAPPPPPPPTPAPTPQLPDAPIQGAGAAARSKAASAMGPMQTIINVGGAGGLTTPADTTNSKKQLGA